MIHVMGHHRQLSQWDAHVGIGHFLQLWHAVALSIGTFQHESLGTFRGLPGWGVLGLQVLGKIHWTAKGLVAQLAFLGELLAQFQIWLEQWHGSCVDQNLQFAVDGWQVSGQIGVIVITTSLDHMCLKSSHCLKDSSTVSANWGLVHGFPALQPLSLSSIMGAQVLKEQCSSVEAAVAELTLQGQGWSR